MADRALQGQTWGWFAPTYKILGEAWRESRGILAPVAKRTSEVDKRIELITGGVLEFWSLDNPDAGRSRRYHGVVVDEAAMVPKLEQAWNEAIRPTLTDFAGEAWFPSTPKGRGFYHALHTMGMDPGETEWAAWTLPTSTNPHIPASEIEAARRQLPDRVFRQEFLAEFIEDAGGVFIGVSEAVDRGRTLPDDPKPGGVYSIGVDLARVEDFTVLSVLDEGGRQAYLERFNQISWERQVARIEWVAGRYPGIVYVDSTGVGDPIYERLRKIGISVEGYQLTNSSKEALIDGLAMRIEAGTIRLLDDPVQTAEMQAYEYELTASRNVRMNAPPGMHDDTVIALALAAYGIRERQKVTWDVW